MTWILVFTIGLFAGTLAGVIGFGGTTILLPILTFVFGPKAAVPIMAIASIQGNLGRVIVWWREISWPTVLAFSIPAIPATWLGARTMLAIEPRSLELFLGAFFIAMIPSRRWLQVSGLKVSLPGMAFAGGVIGYFTGIVANTGPINAPFFLAHGLAKGGFVGTEAMSSLTMFSSKSLAFYSFGALPRSIIINGLIVGLSLMIGAWLAKKIIERLNVERFNYVMDVALFITGIAMIIGAMSAF